MSYRIEILRSARKQVLSLPRQAQLSVAGAIDRLADEPRPVNCRKLRGTDLWRIRMERYRVIYSIDGESGVIKIVKVAARREDTYQWL